MYYGLLKCLSNNMRNFFIFLRHIVHRKKKWSWINKRTKKRKRASVTQTTKLEITDVAIKIGLVERAAIKRKLKYNI